MIKLSLNASEGIKLNLPLFIDKLTYYHEIDIYYYSTDLEVLIGISILFEIISDLEDALIPVLGNNRNISETILQKGVGYYSNIENEEIVKACINENTPYVNSYNKYGVWLRDYLTYL